MKEPITLEELKGLGSRIDTEVVIADSIEGMYSELNAKYPHEQWTLIRCPFWCGEKLVALVIKPREE
jgi:hypothetical protein